MITFLKPFILTFKDMEEEIDTQKAYTVAVLRKVFMLYILLFVLVIGVGTYFNKVFGYNWNNITPFWESNQDIFFLSILCAGIFEFAMDFFVDKCLKPFKSDKQQKKVLSKWYFIIPKILGVISIIFNMLSFVYISLIFSCDTGILRNYLIMTFVIAGIIFMGAISYTYYSENRKKLYSIGFGYIFIGSIGAFLFLFNISSPIGFWVIGLFSLGTIMMLLLAIAHCRDRVADIKKAHPKLNEDDLNILIKGYQIADVVNIFSILVLLLMELLAFGDDD